MRFRSPIPNTGAHDAAGGIGNFFRSMAMAPLYEAQAADEAQTAQARRDLLGAQTRLADAGIGKTMAEAAIAQREAELLKGRPDVLNLMGATRAGMSVPEFQAAIAERTNGAPAMGPAMLPQPIPGVGASGRTAAFDDALLTLYGPAMATPADKLNWDQIAQAKGHYQDQGVMDEAAAAARGGDFMRSSALSAVRGKKEFTPFAAVGNTGTSLNQVTGEQPVTNPGLRTLFGDKIGSEIAENRAQAGSADASAGASRALAGLRGVQTGNERTKGAMEALDLKAMQSGQPLPSSNKISRGADSTDAKFRNQVILAVMRQVDYATLSQAEKVERINAELEAAGMDPVQPKEMAQPQGADPGAGSKAPGKQIDMKAAEAVRSDFKAGRITRDEAKKRLRALGMD